MLFLFITNFIFDSILVKCVGRCYADTISCNMFTICLHHFVITRQTEDTGQMHTRNPYINQVLAEQAIDLVRVARGLIAVDMKVMVM